MSDDNMPVNADHITSRRTNTSGRSLLAISAAIIFSLWFNWDFSKLWGLSTEAGIEQGHLRIASIAVLVFLLIAHVVNWYSDFMDLCSHVSPTIDALIRETEITINLDTNHLLELEADKSRQESGARQMVYGGPSSEDLGKTIKDRKISLRRNKGVRRSYMFQLWGLNLIPPVLAGTIALGCLIVKIWQS